MLAGLAPSSPSTLKVPGSYDRVATLQDTTALVPEIRRRFGITRVAETTFLDRTAIPTFSAFVPRSSDLLSVYSGKGATRPAALLSAVMEAVERQSGAAPDLQSHWRPATSIIEELGLDPSRVRAAARDRDVECFHGRDLFNGEPLSVPRAMVQCPWQGERFLEGGINTNGLASGNTLLEAIYHALSEVIERHAWSMNHAKCVLVPRFYGGADATDAAIAPEISFPTGDAAVDTLWQMIAAGGLKLRAFSLSEADLPYVMLASVTDSSTDRAMAHIGMGCSLCPPHALIRALTESIQDRVVDIQGAREDILREDETHRLYTIRGRRERTRAGRWCFDLPARQIQLARLPDRSSADLLDDLEVMIASLRALGVPRAAIVDLSPPELPIRVIRAIVPSLETTAIDGTIGTRAAALFNPFAAC